MDIHAYCIGWMHRRGGGRLLEIQVRRPLARRVLFRREAELELARECDQALKLSSTKHKGNTKVDATILAPCTLATRPDHPL